MAVELLRAGHQGRDLLLLDDLPVDELLDIGVIEIENDHLGRPACRPARLDRAGGPVADLEEAHQAARLAAAGERFAAPAEIGEIRAGPGAVLEDAGLADPQIHDPALIDEIVLDRLDKASVRGRMFVGRGRADHLARGRIDAVVPLRAAPRCRRPSAVRC